MSLYFFGRGFFYVMLNLFQYVMMHIYYNAILIFLKNEVLHLFIPIVWLPVVAFLWPSKALKELKHWYNLSLQLIDYAEINLSEPSVFKRHLLTFSKQLKETRIFLSETVNHQCCQLLPFSFLYPV